MSPPVTPLTLAHRGGSGPPLVLLHGFLDSWRTWELVLPALERRHDVLAPTLAGHAGGPPLAGDIGERPVVDAVERTMDEAGFETAHIAGNSLGGYVALQLAARGRAESVVALPLIDRALHTGWSLDAGRIDCPVRIVWGTEDRLLPWPAAAARYREDWLPHADWVVLDGVGHCPQLDVPVETAALILGHTSP